MSNGTQAAIRSLEHDTGISPLGSDADHCPQCKCASAGHPGGTVEIMTLASAEPVATICDSCGADLAVES